ncbi:hypothetical protein BH23PSE1_BH23PSE1_14250 [soil metagenome]
MTGFVMVRMLAGLGLAGVLGACAQMAVPGGEPDVMAAAGDACGAEPRQDFVGQSVAVLNDAELPENRRVLFPGMMATTDFLPERLNIDVGPDDEIVRVYCG